MALCNPEIEQSRYFDVQLTDMYTNNVAYMGGRIERNDAGCVLVAGPGWSGETPAGVKAKLQSETEFALVVFRTQLFSPDNMPNVVEVQAGYSAQPLSAFHGLPAPPAAPAVDWPAETPAAVAGDSPRYLNFLLQFAPAGTPSARRRGSRRSRRSASPPARRSTARSTATP